jgi:hypothetical protein
MAGTPDWFVREARTATSPRRSGRSTASAASDDAVAVERAVAADVDDVAVDDAWQVVARRREQGRQSDTELGEAFVDHDALPVGSG